MADRSQASRASSLSDARILWAMEIGTRLAVEQAEANVRAKMRRLGANPDDSAPLA